MPQMSANWFGKWALITGASAGIGVALADELASRLTATYKVSTEVFPADLADSNAPENIFAFTKEKGLEIDLLINNAGFGQYGEFPSVEKQRLLDMVQVNCHAVVHLTRLYLPEMIARHRGDILILASTASFQAVPYISTYAATKAFDLLFAEGLAEEMKPYGIRICALCPGSTKSEFHAVAGQEKFQRKAETAEKVVRTGLKALAAGKSYIISGLGNYLGAHGERFVLRRLVTRIAANMFKPTKK